MARTIGYHLVKTGYGLWLPGDQRGHWSEAWDARIGLIEPRTLHPGDPVRRRMAAERLAQAPTRLDAAMIRAVAGAIAQCTASSDWNVAAASLESTHMHLMLTYTTRRIETTSKWIADAATKAVLRQTPFTGRVWCKGRWLEFIYEAEHWHRLRQYIENHNRRRHEPARPYPWIGP